VIGDGKTRVLQVLPSISPTFGGPVSSALAVAEAYAPFVEVMTVSTGTPSRQWQCMAVKTFPAAQLPMLPPFVGQLSLAMLRWLSLNASAYAFAHIHLNRGLVTLPAAGYMQGRVPYIVQTHGMCSPWSGLKRLVDEAVVWPLLRRAVAVLTLSDSESHELAGVGVHNSVVVPNALRSDLCDNVGRVQPRPLSAEGRPVRLLFCARLHPRKGLDLFLRTCAHLVLSGMPVAAVVAGPDEGALVQGRALAAELKLDVEFCGVLGPEKVQEVMLTSDLLLHPAADEPFGMSMLEAFALRLPVIAHRTSGLASTFRAAEVAVLPDGDGPDSWASAIRKLLADPQRMEAQRSRAVALVASRYSISSLSANLRAVCHYGGLLP
jgi:glycosyltransferase involved in cell wall biosynthesis